MKNGIIIAILILLMLASSNLYGTNPKLKKVLSITNVKVQSYDKTNGTAVIQFQVDALENFNGNMKLSMPNSVSDAELKSETKFLSLSKSGSEIKTVSVKIPENDISYIGISVSVPSADIGYKKNYYYYFKIHKSSESLQIINPLEKSSLNPKTAGKEISILRGPNGKMGMESLNYTVNISGRILINNLDEGLYGNGVALWFRNSNAPDEWYNPIIGHQLHGDYDLLDEQGNFNFNFSFTGDLTAYNQAIVIVNTANDATYLPAPPDGYISWGPNGFTEYFNESEGVIAAINGTNNNIIVNQNGEINQEDGQILRYMEVARELTIQNYSGNCPYTIPPVQTSIAELGPNIAGLFTVELGGDHYITIDPQAVESNTITHEYGHYINFRMWNNDIGKWSTADDNLVEGWAIFYSFAARSYLNKSYGDIIDDYDDNTELAPFIDSPYRYYNMRYARHGEPMKAANASYIWNCYDGYGSNNFEMTYYIGDNDDVSGYYNAVFTTMRSMPDFATISDFHFHFLTDVPTDQQSSVIDINFFMFDDLYNIPTHKMRTAQIVNPALTVLSQNQMRLSWTPRSYSSYYTEKNAPTGYKVYKNVSGSWQNIATANYGTNNVDVPLVTGLYKFTSYNSSGDSYDAIEKQVVSVSLNTANYYETGSGDYYKVNGTNVGSTWSNVFLQSTNTVTVEAVPPEGWVFESWSNGSTTNPIVVPTNSNINLYANYKGHLLSNNQEALSNGSQRKLVRTNNGIYHLCYESMGWIWYTYSLTTNFNGAWSDEQPIWGKNPSMDFEGNNLKIIIESNFYDGSIILLTISPDENDEYIFYDDYDNIISNFSLSYYGNAKPVIAINGNEQFFVYRKSLSEGLFYKRFWFANGVWHYDAESTIPHTTFTSINPSIAIAKQGVYNEHVHIVYQEGNLTPAIKYVRWNGTPFSSDYTISSTSGFNTNYYPSISLFQKSTYFYEPIVSWLGNNTETLSKSSGISIPEPRVVVRTANDSYNRAWGSCNVFGESVSSAQNNSVFNVFNKSVITWGQGDGSEAKWVKRDETSYYGPYCLLPAGLNTGVSNGTSLSEIKASTLDCSEAPYIINQSPESFLAISDCGGIQKVITTYPYTFSRAGVILLKGIEFTYHTGDVVVDDSAMQFIGVPDTLTFSSPSELNQILKTDDFLLHPNSSMVFSNRYYVLNKDLADSVLTGDESVAFRVELVNSTSGNVTGTFDNVEYDKNNLDDYENISYQVDCSGIAEGSYYFRLVISVSGDAEYNLINAVNNASILAKRSFKDISFTGETLPMTYNLSQNYPNPFNPTTTINYQIPQPGLVTLKVYDIIGREVATLVNEQKTQGRYSVNFDASKLASGVYIYQVRANDFVSSKKMLLIK